MKRLLKKAELLELYHGTSTNFLPSIMKQGLIPSNESKNTPYEFGSEIETKYKDCVYLALDELYAADMASQTTDKYGGAILVIGVEVDSENLIADEDYTKGDENKINNWKESLYQWGSVAHKGAISPQSIKSLIIYDDENDAHYEVDLNADFESIKSYFNIPLNERKELPKGLKEME